MWSNELLDSLVFLLSSVTGIGDGKDVWTLSSRIDKKPNYEFCLVGGEIKMK